MLGILAIHNHLPSEPARSHQYLSDRFWYDANVILMSETLIYRIKRWTMIYL
jgi:hypothetical protein